MDSWRPETFSLTPAALLKVNASYIDSADLCPQLGYVKSHHRSKIVGTHGWTKRWDDSPFVHKLFVQALAVYHQLASRPEFERIAAGRRTYEHAHPGLRTFLDHALGNYLDFLGSREVPGRLVRYLGHEHQIRIKPGSALAVWGAPAYEISTGHVEVHRLRIKRTHPEVTGWAHLAAYIAGRASTMDVEFISVVDVSLYHDPNLRQQESILLDRISADEAEAGYRKHARPRALAIVAGGPPAPGHGCGDCQVAGVCDALVPMDGALQQEGAGPYTRSVSAGDLVVYERCPARWYLEKKSNLPPVTEWPNGEAIARGLSVHTWLKLAHGRRRACSADDMPIPSEWGPSNVGFGALDEQHYAAALPFLLSHLEHCALGEDVEVLLADETLYGWDATADTVIACRPDLVYRRDGTLVLRETKTTEGAVAKDSDEARDAYDGIVYWLLTMCSAGYLRYFDAAVGRVELEILGPDESICHSYSTNDFALGVVAETRVRHQVADWHEDTTWVSKPSFHCASCPMAVWCPDRDAYKTRVPSTRGATL